MIASTKTLLEEALREGYAIGAFNVYNLEAVVAVIKAATIERSPIILQLHSAPLRFGGAPLISLCIKAAERAAVPVSVHLDHATVAKDIQAALCDGVYSIMADGSLLPFCENILFTKEIAAMVHHFGGYVEAELGRLSGTEDCLNVAERDAKLTDPNQAQDFVRATGADALAVCVGNVHGNYAQEPMIDFDRLSAIRDLVDLPLVLHGASGLPMDLVHTAIKLGVTKFNVNTELRNAYVSALKNRLRSVPAPDLLDLMELGREEMLKVVMQKLRLFKSSGKASSVEVINA